MNSASPTGRFTTSEGIQHLFHVNMCRMCRFAIGLSWVWRQKRVGREYISTLLSLVLFSSCSSYLPHPNITKTLSWPTLITLFTRSDSNYCVRFFSTAKTTIWMVVVMVLVRGGIVALSTSETTSNRWIIGVLTRGRGE